MPDARHFCQADAIQVLNIDSTNIQPEHWLLIARTIEDYYNQYDGFVICHGIGLLWVNISNGKGMSLVFCLEAL